MKFLLGVARSFEATGPEQHHLGMSVTRGHTLGTSAGTTKGIPVYRVVFPAGVQIFVEALDGEGKPLKPIDAACRAEHRFTAQNVALRLLADIQMGWEGGDEPFKHSEDGPLVSGISAAFSEISRQFEASFGFSPPFLDAPPRTIEDAHASLFRLEGISKVMRLSEHERHWIGREFQQRRVGDTIANGIAMYRNLPGWRTSGREGNLRKGLWITGGQKFYPFHGAIGGAPEPLLGHFTDECKLRFAYFVWVPGGPYVIEDPSPTISLEEVERAAASFRHKQQ